MKDIFSKFDQMFHGKETFDLLPYDIDILIHQSLNIYKPEDIKTDRFIAILFAFAMENRFSKPHHIEQTVVCAIRQLSLIVPERFLDNFALFFQPTATNTLSAFLELHLISAILLRLRHIDNLHCPRLEFQLSQLVSDYLITRLVLNKHSRYSLIIVEAIISVWLLDGDRQNKFVEQIIETKIDWLQENVQEFLYKLIQNRQQDKLEVKRLKEIYNKLWLHNKP